MVTATLNKWGNSQGIILPKAICDAMGLSIGDKLNLIATEDHIEVKPAKRSYHRTKKLSAEDVFSLWQGEYETPTDFPKTIGNEIDYGAPAGKEVW